MPPRKILKNRCPDIEFGSIMGSFMAVIIICINFKIQINLISSYLAK